MTGVAHATAYKAALRIAFVRVYNEETPARRCWIVLGKSIVTMATVSETTTTVELTPLPALNNPRSNPAAATAAAETARLGSTRQRIFDVAPSNILSKATRSLITTLIILANVVQFVSNFVTIAAGTTFTRDFGRKSGPGQANWMPASYRYSSEESKTNVSKAVC